MNSKRILHTLIVDFKNGDAGKASSSFKKYINKKLNEMHGDYDDYNDDDDYSPDANDRFNVVEDLDHDATFDVAGHKIELGFIAKVHGAEHGETATHTDPSWSETYEYGEVHDIGKFKFFKVDGVLIEDNFEMFTDATARKLQTRKGVEYYFDEIIEIVEQSEHPIPKEIKALFAPEFAKAIVFSFGKYLESKEGHV